MPATLFYTEEDGFAIGPNQEKEIFSIGSQARRLSGVYVVFGRIILKYRGATIADVTNNIRAGTANIKCKFMRCSERHVRATTTPLFFDPIWNPVDGSGAVVGEIRDGMLRTIAYIMPNGISLNSALTSFGLFTHNNDRYETIPYTVSGTSDYIGPCRLLVVIMQNNFGKPLELMYQFYIIKYPG